MSSIIIAAAGAIALGAASFSAQADPTKGLQPTVAADGSGVTVTADQIDLFSDCPTKVQRVAKTAPHVGITGTTHVASWMTDLGAKTYGAYLQAVDNDRPIIGPATTDVAKLLLALTTDDDAFAKLATDSPETAMALLQKVATMFAHERTGHYGHHIAWADDGNYSTLKHWTAAANPIAPGGTVATLQTVLDFHDGQTVTIGGLQVSTTALGSAPHGT